MRLSTWLVVGALACGGVVGCERAEARKGMVLSPTTRAAASAERPQPVPAPATRQAPTTPRAATQASAAPAAPVAQAKRASHMLVNGTAYEFPEARLVLKREGEQMVALLVSNDPQEVLKPDYHGNRYYFELRLGKLEGAQVGELSQGEFRYRAGSAAPADTPNGIFLDGDRVHYQPYDVQIVFDREGEYTIADIAGQFLFFPKGQIVGQMLPVQASLAAKAEVRN